MRKQKDITIKKTLWDKILKKDIRKQANLVNLFGIAGMIVLVISCIFLLSVEIPITIPMSNLEVIVAEVDEVVFRGSIDRSFYAKVINGQVANIKCILENDEKIFLIGNIESFVIDEGKGSSEITIRSVAGSASHDIGDNKCEEINIRIVLDKMNVLELFIQKKG